MSLNERNILPCIEIEPKHPARHSLILLHGLGADGNDFVPMVPELNLPDASNNIRFIFPHAPIMPVTLNNGYEMRAWYDIYGLAIDTKTDSQGISLSVAHIGKLIEREVERGIPTDKIYLAGFSQGAAIALTTGICYHQPLAGIIALSGYLPLAQEIPAKASPANKNIPIFLAHGTQDPIVPYGLGLATHSFLKQAGYSVEWHSYPMPHSVCNDEIRDISRWLTATQT